MSLVREVQSLEDEKEEAMTEVRMRTIEACFLWKNIFLQLLPNLHTRRNVIYACTCVY